MASLAPKKAARRRTFRQERLSLRFSALLVRGKFNTTMPSHSPPANLPNLATGFIPLELKLPIAELPDTDPMKESLSSLLAVA